MPLKHNPRSRTIPPAKPKPTDPSRLDTPAPEWHGPAATGVTRGGWTRRRRHSDAIAASVHDKWPMTRGRRVAVGDNAACTDRRPASATRTRSEPGPSAPISRRGAARSVDAGRPSGTDLTGARTRDGFALRAPIHPGDSGRPSRTGPSGARTGRAGYAQRTPIHPGDAGRPSRTDPADTRTSRAGYARPAPIHHADTRQLTRTDLAGGRVGGAGYAQRTAVHPADTRRPSRDDLAETGARRAGQARPTPIHPGDKCRPIWTGPSGARTGRAAYAQRTAVHPAEARWPVHPAEARWPVHPADTRRPGRADLAETGASRAGFARRARVHPADTRQLSRTDSAAARVGRAGYAGRARVDPVDAGGCGRARVAFAALRSRLSHATQPVGVPPRQAPPAMALVLAAELVTFGRIVARCGPVAHFRQFRRGEQL
jgi:hypothetical protein